MSAQSSSQDLALHAGSKRKRVDADSNDVLDKLRAASAQHEQESQPPPEPLPPPQTQNSAVVNYLDRAHTIDIPLVSPEDSLSSVLHILTAYHGVLDRRESLALNLGSKPQGGSRAQHFENHFSGKPKVVLHATGNANNSSEQLPTVTWQDVVLFAQKFPDGLSYGISPFAPSLQEIGYYYPPEKNGTIRVEISQRDYHLIKSGLPQRLLEPNGGGIDANIINQDHERESATLEILERSVAYVTTLADQIAATARRVNRRLKGRREDMLSSSNHETAQIRPGVLDELHRTFAAVRQAQQTSALSGNQAISQYQQSAAPTPRRKSTKSSAPESTPNHASAANVFDQSNAPFLPPHFAGTQPVFLAPYANSPLSNAHGTSPHTASYANMTVNPPMPVARKKRISSHALTPSGQDPSRPTNPPLLPPPDPPHVHAFLVSIATLPRGALISPPCDRCRRLKIECVKNLSACGGCTRKHARCTWRDVAVEELAIIGLVQQGQPSQQDVQQPHNQGQALSQDNTHGNGSRGQDEHMRDADAVATQNGPAMGGDAAHHTEDSQSTEMLDHGHDREQEERDAVRRLALFAESANAASVNANAMKEHIAKEEVGSPSGVSAAPAARMGSRWS